MKKYLFMLLAAMTVFVACNEDEPGFETPPAVERLKVSTLTATEIGENEATLNGEILNVGETGIKDVSFYYWEQGDMNTRKKASIELEEGKSFLDGEKFSVHLEDLKSYFDYAYTFAVEDQDARQDGDPISFSTLISSTVSEPSAETLTHESVTFNRALLSGKLISDGGSDNPEITIVCWPKGSPERQSFFSPEKDTDGNFILSEGGVFTAWAENLAPDQEYRYYVVVQNEFASGSGEIKSFVTNSTIYVNLLAPDGGTGASWDSAFNSIGEAMGEAKEGVKIWVAATGDYKEFQLELKKGVDLYGGFAGTENTMEERPENLKTVINAEGLAPDAGKEGTATFKMSASNLNDECKVERFVIKNGKARKGVLYILSGSPHFTDCDILDNQGQYGAAGYLLKNKAVFTRCLFEGNYSTKRAGVFLCSAYKISVDDNSPFFNECVFKDNEAGDEAGALELVGKPRIRNCIFENNRAGKRGSVINMKTSSCVVFEGQNVVIGDPTSSDGAHYRSGGADCGGPDGWVVAK
ncbi:hypothetical protein FUAX_48590 (plasmid) [Fulvitalea axinellae]|uniref:Right handed beta helix region n=1 Tax=Fulvitalea axinellae TaxID=1182444 RepID=A0AAU9D4M1_9BACT|nr:hypothetical protein FUAX_48590 [Fulvitalea axinellae]